MSVTQRLVRRRMSSLRIGHGSMGTLHHRGRMGTTDGVFGLFRVPHDRIEPLITVVFSMLHGSISPARRSAPFRPACAQKGSFVTASARLPIRLRLARPEDAEAMAAIYAPFVDTPVTFEEQAPDADEFRRRLATITERFPWIVAEEVAGAEMTVPSTSATSTDTAAPAGAPDARGANASRVVGYAYAHPMHEREAFQWNAELSVYLAPEAQRRGLGTAFYRALIHLLTLQGVKAVYGVVTVPNAGSERLHDDFGFELVWLQKNAGFTCGDWHDVAWFVKPVAPFDANPEPPVPFPVLLAEQPETVAAALEASNPTL